MVIDSHPNQIGKARLWGRAEICQSEGRNVDGDDDACPERLCIAIWFGSRPEGF